jgi:hypothetical protein
LLVAPRAPRPLTKLMIPAGPGAPAREVGLQALAVAEQVRVRVRTHLLRVPTDGGADDLSAAIEAADSECKALYEDALAAALAAGAEHRAEMARVECRRGCAFCCHVDVTVTPLEAIRLSQHARAAGRAVPATEASARYAPCPLLEDGACTVYAMRPFACRSLFSPDATACEAGFAGEGRVFVPSLAWPRFLASAYITGEIGALEDLRLAGHLVELRRALALLLADATALPRWLRGADVFARHAGVAR